MTKRHRVLCAVGLAAMTITFFGASSSAHANSRRHVFKPDNTVEDTKRESAPGAEAPEIDGASLGLGLALAIGGLAVLTGRRRTAGN